MKIVFTFLFGYAWHGYRYEMSGDSYGSVETVYSVGSQSFYIPYNELLIVEEVSSGHKYEIAFTPQNEGVVDYKWRSLETEDKAGEGSLFENFETTSIDLVEFANEVKDVGSNLQLSVGGNRLQWSINSPTAGWIMYDPSQIALSVRRGSS